MTEEEVEHLFRIIAMLKKRGCGIIYISHKMDEILRISDEVTVMRDGRWVATRDAKELTMEEIIRLMVGRELTNRFPPKDNVPGEVILEVEHLAGKYTRLKDASFQLRKGEVLGIAGLDGSGRTEVLENLFGAMTKESGTIRLHGKQIRNKTPREVIKNGFALLTEERRATGIFGIRDIKENTVISNLNSYLFGAHLPQRKENEEGHRVGDPGHAHQDPEPCHADPLALRRQPAEGHHRPLAPDDARRCCCSMSRRAASTWAQNTRSIS